MRMNNISLNVLVKGRQINEYPHMGQTFVEGRDGSVFEIEVCNHSGQRIEAIVSVDGRSVTDGKAAGPQSRGYLIDAYGSVRIPGFKINDRDAAAFTFTGPGKSYDEAMGGTGANRGVIGVMAYAEKSKPVYVPPVRPYQRPHYPTPWDTADPWDRRPRTFLGSGGVAGYVPREGEFYGVQNGIGDPSIHMAPKGIGQVNMGVATSATNAVGNDPGYSRLVGASGALDRSFAYPTASANVTDYSYSAPVEQTLGTAFGERTEFKTTSVDFQRGDMVVMMALYYDDARGLRKRGIVLERPSRTKVKNHRPDAFPGMGTGCAVPPGWRG